MAKAQAQEPSMEEILASIRRIIADEDTGSAAATKIAAVATKAPEPVHTTVSEDDLDKLFNTDDDDDDDDVLVLSDNDKASAEQHMEDELDISFEPAPPVPPAPKPQPKAVKAAVVPPPRPEPVKAAAPAPSFDRRRAPEPERDEPAVDPLLSQATDHMVTAAFDNLAMTILNKNARTVEDLIEDMLRPMLRSWLDENLPSLVERLVRAEIERVSRGR